MNKNPDVILAVEGDEEYVECPQCEGSEGSCDENDEWHECVFCHGEGGYWRERSTEGKDEAR